MNVRKFLRDLAGLDDPPHKIAMGLALGIFVGFLPIMGIQMAVVLPFALLFRANKPAAIGGVWITNPVTVIPIYYINYKVGDLFLRYPPLHWRDFQDLFTNINIDKFLKLGEQVLWPLVLGGFVLAVFFAIPTYFVTRTMVLRARRRRAKRRAARALRRGSTPE